MIFSKGGQPVLTLSAGGDVTFAPCCEDENLPVALAPGELAIKAGNGDLVLASRPYATSAATSDTDIALRGRLSTQVAFPPAPGSGLQIKAPDGSVAALLSPIGDLLVRGEDVSVLPNLAVDGGFARGSFVYAQPGLNYPASLSGVYNHFNNQALGTWSTGTIDLSAVYNELSDPALSSPEYAEAEQKEHEYQVALAAYKLNNNVPNYQAAVLARTAAQLALQTYQLARPNYQWPFNPATVPLNGFVRVPVGAGPFPLIVFAHGNHTPLVNSSRGYSYLSKRLASLGFIAASIDVDFMNGDLWGENGARAIVHLEHLKQFRTWNSRVGHPLYGKVDLDRVIIAGHSRGGEAVAHASMFNRMSSFKPTLHGAPVALNGQGLPPLGPYNFGLRGLIAIAPTDDQYQPVAPLLHHRTISTVVDQTSYLLIHGTMDADVTSFPGYRAYDRALPYDLDDMTRPASGTKALLWLYKANHNYFNTVWGLDDGQDASTLIAEALQQQFAQVMFGAWALVLLGRRSSYWSVLRRPPSIATWLGGAVDVVTEFHDRNRLWLQSFDNSGLIQITSPVTGTVDTTGCTAEQRYLAFPDPNNPAEDDGEEFLYEQTGGLRVAWAGADHYIVRNLAFPVDITRFQVLSLRVGQSPEAANPLNGLQDFTLVVTDANGHAYQAQASVFAALASSYNGLAYPGELSNPPGFPGFKRKMVMQTLRIPLGLLADAGLDVRRIVQIEFVFNITPAGVLYFDDLQLCL